MTMSTQAIGTNNRINKALGFQDLDKNGLIEKSKNEGYNKSADIDLDGEITSAEANYYYIRTMTDPKNIQEIQLDVVQIYKDVLVEIIANNYPDIDGHIKMSSEEATAQIEFISAQVISLTLNDEQTTAILRTLLESSAKIRTSDYRYSCSSQILIQAINAFKGNKIKEEQLEEIFVTALKNDHSLENFAKNQFFNLNWNWKSDQILRKAGIPNWGE